MDDMTHSQAIAALIAAHLDTLVEQALRTAIAQLPWYRSLPEEGVRQMFRQDYQALAQMLATGQMPELRTYVERTGLDRLTRGAPATSLIAGISLLETGLGPLIHEHLKDDPARAADSARRVGAIIRNIRMIVSSLNLRLLTQGGALPPAAEGPR